MSRIYEQGTGYLWVNLAKKYINICKKILQLCDT